MSIASNKISRKNVERLLQRTVVTSDKNGDAIEVEILQVLMTFSFI